MKRVILVALIGLVGCGPKAEQQIAQCEIEAVHLYPQYEAGVTNDYKYQSYVQTCMEARGFGWDSSRKDCHGDFRSVACYAPPSN